MNSKKEQRSEMIRRLKKALLNLKTLMESPKNTPSRILKSSVTALYKCLKEAEDSHCDFLADEATTETDYDAAEKEWDSFVLDVWRTWDIGEEELENRLDDSLEKCDYAPENTESEGDTKALDTFETDHPELEIPQNINDTETEKIVESLPETNDAEVKTLVVDFPDSFENLVTDETLEPEKSLNKSIPEFIERNCDLCDDEDNSKCPLKVHNKTVHGEGILSCHDCENKNASNDKLSDHVICKQDEKSNKYVNCESKVVNSCNLKLHVETIHESKVPECEYCLLATRFTTLLVLHKKHRHEDNDEETFKYEHQFLGCNHCGDEFQFLSTFWHHKPHVHEECGKCVERSRIEDLFGEHIKITHSHHNNHTCGLCESETNVRNHLTPHPRGVHRKHKRLKILNIHRSLSHALEC